MGFFTRRGERRTRASAPVTADDRGQSEVSRVDPEQMALRVAELLQPVLNSLEERLGSLERLGARTISEPSVPARPTRTEPVPDPEPDFETATTDELHAFHVRRYLRSSFQSPPNGSIETLTIVGELRDGSIAWCTEEGTMCGRAPKEVLGDIPRERGQTFRARVASRHWGCYVTIVMPLVGRSPSRTEDFTMPNPVPEAVANSWQSELRVGDVVIARVPYDGSKPYDDQGRRGKDRPAVFIRWENEYALCRAIYGADGHVLDQELGQRLVDTGCLDKASVVRNAEYDLDPAKFSRRIGTVGPRDRKNMNLPEAPASHPPTSSRFTGRPVRGTNGAEPVVPNPIRQAMSALHGATLARTNPSSTKAVLRTMLELMSEQSDIRRALYTDGITFAVVGDAFASIIKATSLRIAKGTFSTLMGTVSEEMGETPYGYFRTVIDEHGHPVLHLTLTEPEGAPLDPVRTMSRGEATTSIQLEILDDYETPDLILFDQFSVARMVGESRLDLARELNRLRNGREAPAHVIGSAAEPSWRAFQSAAQSRGWRIVAAENRDELITVAARLAVEREITVITVVSHFADLVAELENLGFTVNLVSDTCPMKGED